MKITDRFVGDHKTFRKLLGEIDTLAQANQPDRARLIRFVEIFVDHLILHAWGEETFYYPAVKEKSAGAYTPEYFDLLDEEHALVDDLMKKLEEQVKQQPMNPAWKETYRDFQTGLTAHMQKEEEDLFPKSEELLGRAGLEELSATLERRRKEAPAIRIHSSF